MDSPDTRTDVTHLGDGAYAGLEDGVIVLFTSDGVRDLDRVVFENPRHAQQLVRVLQDLLAKIGMHTVVYENEAEWRNEEWREQADADQAKEDP